MYLKLNPKKLTQCTTIPRRYTLFSTKMITSTETPRRRNPIIKSFKAIDLKIVLLLLNFETLSVLISIKL